MLSGRRQIIIIRIAALSRQWSSDRGRKMLDLLTLRVRRSNDADSGITFQIGPIQTGSCHTLAAVRGTTGLTSRSLSSLPMAGAPFLAIGLLYMDTLLSCSVGRVHGMLSALWEECTWNGLGLLGRSSSESESAGLVNAPTRWPG